ncbi:MAG: hypothetical protein K0U54_08870 [Bacteroidetes bacterium]|nr:hypothetical protein [Bacteroidota bacterium]
MNTSNTNNIETKKVLFLVPDGVGVRNYLYSSLITQLKSKCSFTVWTTLSKDAIDEVATIHNTHFNYKHITLEKESFKTRFYRESARFARLKRTAALYDNPTVLQSNWNFRPKTRKRRLFQKLPQIVGQLVSGKYDSILSFEKRARNAWSRQVIDFYKKALLEERPDVLFITHQRVYALMPICLAAKELGIKVITCIYSWDNTPKASLGVWADTYVVWSSLMKEQLKDLYPEIPQTNVVITGSPQFEFYANNGLQESREHFAKQYNLDINKRWVCFSGDDIKTSPYDPAYLEDVAQAAMKLDHDVHIVFRKCPVDYSNRYDEVLEKYGDIITAIDPIWVSNTDNWGAVFPKKEDISLLVNVVKHCDLVLNLGSTMAHDFAVYNKPCLYYKYDPVTNKDWSVHKTYNYQHFRSMDGLEPVGWVENKEALISQIKKALEQPETVGPDRQEWMERIVRHPLSESSRLIAKQLLDI